MKETDIFEFLHRVKSCTRARPDTYFAIHKESRKKVFVKGPLYQNFCPKTFSSVQLIKEKAFELPIIKYEVIALVPDMKAIEGSYRALVNTEKEYYFIYCDIFHNRIHITDKERKTNEFSVIVAFRELLGIGDVRVNENFIIENGKIYSVDEDGYYNSGVLISKKSLKVFKDINIFERIEQLDIDDKTRVFIDSQYCKCVV